MPAGLGTTAPSRHIHLPIEAGALLDERARTADRVLCVLEGVPMALVDLFGAWGIS